MIEFEFDENKSRANLEKHGVDFVDAQKLWDDPDLLEIPVKTEDEPRFLIIGVIAGMESRQAILPDALRVNANLFQTDLWCNHIPRGVH